MTIWDRVDPELIPELAEILKADLVDLTDIPGTRARLAQQRKMRKSVPLVEGIRTEDRWVPPADGDHDVLIRLYRPEDKTHTLPALLYIHGVATFWEALKTTM